MHIVSWNVASWPTTIKLIRQSYGTLERYLERHGVDILCLQEVKCTRRALAEEPRAAGARVAGFDTFWGYNKQQGPQAGFNGVATFAKQGLTEAADGEPLRERALDEQGRCLLTLHGDLAIFNVYVPTSSRGLRQKMRFLQALTRAARRVKSERPGRKVIIAGDLNVAYRGEDMCYVYRRVHLPSLLAQERRLEQPHRHPHDQQQDLPPQQEQHQPRPDASPVHAELQQHQAAAAVPAHIIRKVAAAAPAVMYMLQHKESKVVLGRKSGNSAAYTRLNDTLVVTCRLPDGSSFTLKDKFEDEGDVSRSVGLDEVAQVVEDEEVGGVRKYVAKPEGYIAMYILLQLMEAAGHGLSSHEAVTLANCCGVSNSAPCTRHWLWQVQAPEDAVEGAGLGLVDSFVWAHPTAQGRFTCWEQFRSMRYENKGARIDYILVDPALLGRLVKGPPLQGGLPSENVLPTSAKAALRMAVGLVHEGDQGRYEPAPFDGSGISDAPQHVLDRQFVAPHTGIIYTPPKFSDHVAVSIVLDEKSCGDGTAGNRSSACLIPAPLALQRDPATRRTQPHAQQQTILSVMANRQASLSSNPSDRPSDRSDDKVPSMNSSDKLAAQARPVVSAKGGGKKRPTPAPVKGQRSILSMFSKKARTEQQP
mmetsp:Transcript_6874/g.25353  ORF Transcript_6874/g.25353 Transcript_6874/m.25353 type:complete len:648 (-) Transcript_6874:893-2836(-)